jgi:hypothetical protein
VILLEKSNEWNLFPAKRRILKKRGEQGLKSKRGETSYEEAPCFKRRKRMMKYKLLGEILSKERKKGDHIFLYYKIRRLASSIPTHYLHLHYLLFLDFPLSYLHSLHYSPSTVIICHINSLEFSFDFTIYKV